MIAIHFPALQVVVPLIAAPVCVLLRRGTPAWLLSLAATWTSLAIAVALLLRVQESGPVSYMLGGWAAPWGIEYRVDIVNAFLLVLVSAIGAVVMPYARVSVAAEIAEEQRYLFWTAYLL
ncbi:MAG: hypothetical protein ACREUQ_03150, partial [Burkholderiales bacterium]